MPQSCNTIALKIPAWLGVAIRFLPIASTLCLLVGCAKNHLTGNLKELHESQKIEIADLHSQIRGAPEKAISWSDAHRLMVRDNLSLRQSREQVKFAERATADQWLSLVPRLGAFVNLGESLTQLTNIRSENINAQIIANLNIPNPFDFYAGLYGAALQKQSAEWSHELDRRRAYVQLHTLYHEENLIRDAEKAYERRTKSLASALPNEMANRITSLKNEAESLRRRKGFHRAQINNMLNTPGANWRLQGTPPKIPTLQDNRNLQVGEEFGKLALQLQAVQIEVAQLRIKQSQFRQWPNLTFGLSSPPLFTSNESGQNFSADNMLFFTGANQQFNITDPISRRPVKDARTRLQFTREQLLLRAENEALQISQTRAGYQVLLEEETRLKSRANQPSQLTSSAPEVVLREIEQISEADTNRQEIRRRLHQMDLQFLIWYEKFWESY